MIKKIITSLIYITISFLIITLVILSVISNTVLEKKYIKSVLKQNNYYKQTYERINEEFANYAPQLHIGTEDTKLDDICKEEKVTKDINNIIDNIYKNKKIEVDTKEIKESLDNKVNQMLEKHQRIPTSEEEKALEKWKKSITDSYTNEILYSKKYINKLPKYIKLTEEKIKTIIMINTIISIAFTILLILMKKNIKETIKSLGIINLTTGITLIITKTLCINRIGHILILSERASRVLIYIMKDILTKTYYLGIILGIVGLFGIIIGIEEINTSSKQ